MADIEKCFMDAQFEKPLLDAGVMRIINIPGPDGIKQIFQGPSKERLSDAITAAITGHPKRWQDDLMTRDEPDERFFL